MLQTKQSEGRYRYTHTPDQHLKKKKKDKQKRIEPKGKMLNFLFKSGNQINSQIYNKTTGRKIHFIISQDEKPRSPFINTL